ncbi:Acetylornithine/succinyldiaminopimelate aminotransferase [Paraburkholderia saeva]|nr:Acetylornithine/succinyldiaminopimelate aminotransferase [Paraburkholderia saeva]
MHWTVLRQRFKVDIDPLRVAAFIFEPVQGERGFYMAPTEFVRGLRALCDQYGILLIADEIQTGFARTGELFAMQHYDVEADLMTIAKSLAGGMPLSGVVGRADLMDAAQPGGLGGTYAGNPLTIAAACAVLDVIAEEDLPARAINLGTQLKERLASIQARLPQLAEVRGPGSMVAAGFVDQKTGAPDPVFNGASARCFEVLTVTHLMRPTAAQCRSGPGREGLLPPDATGGQDVSRAARSARQLTGKVSFDFALMHHAANRVQQQLRRQDRS